MKRVLDIECYENYFLVCLTDENDHTMMWERYNDLVTLDAGPFPTDGTLISFNGINYDMVMLGAWMQGYTNTQLKIVSDAIITQRLMPWDMERQYNVTIPRWLDHIDIMNVLPGMASLKIYGGRIASEKLQDLPVAPEAIITYPQVELMRRYCKNDTKITMDLYSRVEGEIQLRSELGSLYGVDLRSKSDAQIAEAVITSECQKITGNKIQRPSAMASYKYVPPPFVNFTTEPLQQLLDEIMQADFIIKDNGQVEMPDVLNQEIEIGPKKYTMGVGGLHSVDGPGSFYSDAGVRVVDIDVASYYPNIILNAGYFPKHIGSSFLQVYRSLVDKRLTAKAAGDKVTADSLKITVNGTFGKLGSKWSKLYSPDLMFHVTVTGQLCLLMLIEKFPGLVISANTDGITLCYERWIDYSVKQHVLEWEQLTGLTMEYVDYRSIHYRDVNNYLAIKPDGEVKSKGIFVRPGLMKNTVNPVVITAIEHYLLHKTPVEETIMGCPDMSQFLTLRTVKGGAVKDEVEYGKSIRWYYSTNTDTAIHYVTNGNKVPRTDGAQLMMDLGPIPEDLDYQWYINEANDILEVIL